jgi:hypothetical protein
LEKSRNFNCRVLSQFQFRDAIKAARIEATEALTLPLATLSRKERVTEFSLPRGER